MNIEVYSASKFPQKTTEAPAAVTVITADEIKKYGYRTLADILRSVRGFYITYDRNYDYVGVRGFNRPGDYNTRILLLLDGHRINENIYDQAFIGTDFPIDIDLIDRVEVIRGSGSSLYGSNAFFAVVNVITRRGKNFHGGEVSGEAGNHETYKTRLSYGNVFDNGLETVLSGSYFDSKGDRRLFFKEFDSPTTNNGIAENLDYNRSSNFFGEFSFRDFTLQSAYSDWKKGVPTASFETIFNDSRFFTRERYFFVDLKYEHTFEDGMGFIARLNYNYHKYHGDYPDDIAEPSGPPFIVVNKDYSIGEWWGGEVQITKKLFERHKVIAGAEYRDNFRQEQGNYDVVVYLDDHRKSRVWAIYAQDEFTILRNLVLNAGVRYDYYSTFGSTTNPRLALIYSPFEKTVFKLIYGTAFRAPNVYELYYNDGEITQKANPGLTPEKIRTCEIVYEQFIGNNLHSTVNLFYNKIKDLINLTTDPADNLLVFKNIGEVKAKGIEVEFERKWDGGLTGRVSYTYQEAEDKETGEILSNSPKHLAKLNIIAPLLKEKIFLGFEEQYTSRRKTLKGNDAKSFYVTNVTLFSQNFMKNFEASVSVYNLFDYRYGDPGSVEHVQDVIQQDGRNFRLKLSYRF
jgi:iron complex outermembrane receptor protein